jgi:hypothetical protein
MLKREMKGNQLFFYIYTKNGFVVHTFTGLFPLFIIMSQENRGKKIEDKPGNPFNSHYDTSSWLRVEFLSCKPWMMSINRFSWDLLFINA